MKLTNRILLIVAVVFIGILVSAPLTTQAQSQKLTSGTYMGRFRYSAYDILIDDQKLGGSTTHVDSVLNAYVEGTLVIQVDNKGKILPGIKFIPDSIPTYYIYTARFTPIVCNVTGYLEGETSIVLKQNSASSFDPKAPSFAANFTFNNVNPLSYSRMGVDTDCPEMATQSFLEQAASDQVTALNTYQLMKFTVLRVSKDQFSGTIVVPGYDKKLSTPGGFITERDKDGFFNVHRIDPLAPLTDDDLAPLVGEWRTK
jgi:hypothetical protein